MNTLCIRLLPIDSKPSPCIFHIWSIYTVAGIGSNCCSYSNKTSLSFLGSFGSCSTCCKWHAFINHHLHFLYFFLLWNFLIFHLNLLVAVSIHRYFFRVLRFWLRRLGRLSSRTGSVFKGRLKRVGIDLNSIFIQLIVRSIVFENFGRAVVTELYFQGGHFVADFAGVIRVLSEELSTNLTCFTFHK